MATKRNRKPVKRIGIEIPLEHVQLYRNLRSKITLANKTLGQWFLEVLKREDKS